jgi:hypothetical protein
VARLALTTGAPVIPIAHWGAQDVLPYGSSRPHLWPRKTVRMVAGPPVDLSAFRDQPLNSATLRDATAVVMTEVTALLAGLRGETPPAVPYDPAGRGRAAAQIGRTEPAAPATDGGVEPADSPAGEPAESGADGLDNGAAAGWPKGRQRTGRQRTGRQRRPARREGRDHGGRLVGNHVRPSALRCRHAVGGLLPQAGARPGHQRTA